MARNSVEQVSAKPVSMRRGPVFAAIAAAMLACTVAAEAQQRIDIIGRPNGPGNASADKSVDLHKVWPLQQWCEDSRNTYEYPPNWQNFLIRAHHFPGTGAKPKVSGHTLELRKKNIEAAKPLLLIFPFCRHFNTKIQGSVEFFRDPSTGLYKYKQGPTGLFLITKIQQKKKTYLLNGYFFSRSVYQPFSGSAQVYTQIDRYENLDVHTGSWTLIKSLCFKKLEIAAGLPEDGYRLTFRVLRADRKFALNVSPVLGPSGADNCVTNWKLREHENVIAVGIMGITDYKDLDESLFIYKLYVSVFPKAFD